MADVQARRPEASAAGGSRLLQAGAQPPNAPLAPEGLHHQRCHRILGHVSKAAPQEDPPRGHQVWHLRARPGAVLFRRELQVLHCTAPPARTATLCPLAARQHG